MILTLRRALIKDVQALLDLSIQARQEHNRISNNYFADIDPVSETAFLEQSINDEARILLVAENKSIVGMISAGLKHLPYVRRPFICQIDVICVDQNHRRQGIGRQLMQALVTTCRNKGVNEIRLGVFNNNPSAVSLYKSLGFLPQEQKMQLFL